MNISSSSLFAGCEEGTTQTTADIMLVLAWTVVMAVSLGPVRAGGHHASIKSEYGQLVTSTTLKWRQMSARRGGMMPKDAVQSGTGNPSKVVCRAEHHGSLLVGQTTPLDGTCAVGFINRIEE